MGVGTLTREIPESSQKECSREIDRRVGRQLRLRREMLDLSQFELGARCDISGQQIHKYEIGTSGIRPSRLVQLSQALAVPVSYFFMGVETIDDYPDDLLELLSNKTNSEILVILGRIRNPAVKQSILEMARTYDRLTSGAKETTNSSKHFG